MSDPQADAVHPKLPSRRDYDRASAGRKGYMTYTFSEWPGSEIPSEAECPYADGTVEATAFHLGVQQAVLDAQDSEG